MIVKIIKSFTVSVVVLFALYAVLPRRSTSYQLRPKPYVPYMGNIKEDTFKCYYTNEGDSLSKGINIKVNVVCDMTKMNYNFPSLIGCYTKKMSDQSEFSIGVSIDDGYPFPSEKNIRNIVKRLKYQKNIPPYGEILSIQPITINNVQGINMACKGTSADKEGKKVFSNYLCYLMYYKDRCVTINYFLSSYKELEAASLFKEYSHVFENMMQLTKIN